MKVASEGGDAGPRGRAVSVLWGRQKLGCRHADVFLSKRQEDEEEEAAKSGLCFSELGCEGERGGRRKSWRSRSHHTRSAFA